MAPAHPHATEVAVYPALLFINKCKFLHLKFPSGLIMNSYFIFHVINKHSWGISHVTCQSICIIFTAPKLKLHLRKRTTAGITFSHLTHIFQYIPPVALYKNKIMRRIMNSACKRQNKVKRWFDYSQVAAKGLFFFLQFADAILGFFLR